MTKLGDLIRAHRVRYGMSQAELSRRIHISQTALNQIELGQTQDPRFSIVQRIAEVLGMPIDRLVKEDTPAARDTRDSEDAAAGLVLALD